MIKIDIDKCIGCRTCELVCSYHHKKCFNPIFSSIKINFKDNYDINITILDTCDYNREEDPSCVKFCPVNAIKLM
jgi:anaerobic carbon-monoxide dehydrogenase iron sulfur subunit